MTTRAWVLSLALATAVTACKRNSDLATAKAEAPPPAADGADAKLEQALADAMPKKQEELYEPADDFAVDEPQATATAAQTGLALDDSGIPPEAGQVLVGQTGDGTALTPDELDTKILEFMEQDIAPVAGAALVGGSGPSEEGSIRGAVAGAVAETVILPGWTKQLADLEASPAGSAGPPAAGAGGAGTGGNVAGAGNSTVVNPDNAAPPVLGLDDASTTRLTGTEKADQVKSLKDRIGRTQKQVDAYRQRNAVFNAVKSSPDQYQCVVNGAILKAGVCQCRGWQMDVAQHTFPVPKGDLKTFLISSLDRRCPLMEQRYCNGWEAKNGGCGLYGKGVGWGVPALAFQDRATDDPDTDCFKHYQQIIKENAQKLFAAPSRSAASCQTDASRTTAYIALKRAEIVELWEFNKTTGAMIGQVDNAKYNQTHNGAQAQAAPADARGPSTGSDPRVTYAGNGTVVTTADDFRGLCVRIYGPARAATWNWNLSACDCGARKVRSVEYLDWDDASRRRFVPLCRGWLGR